MAGENKLGWPLTTKFVAEFGMQKVYAVLIGSILTLPLCGINSMGKQTGDAKVEWVILIKFHFLLCTLLSYSFPVNWMCGGQNKLTYL